MNKKRIINILGKIILVEVLLMLPSLIVALIYNDGDAKYFLYTLIPSLIIGLIMNSVKVSEDKMRSRDGYTIVALAWIIISLIGAVPLYLTGEFRSYPAALFEIVSGFTTTGASVLSSPEQLPHGVLFWRSFTHWVGGMGVLVFMLMIVPMKNKNSMHLVKAEVPGPTAGKLVPRMKKTSFILYSIYAVMTLILFVMLLAGKMPVFDSVCYAFATAGTGGFSISSSGIAGYNSAYLEIVISVFMILFGINFNVYYLILIRRIKEALKNEELWVYLGIVAAAVTVIMVNIVKTAGSISVAFRQALFQVSSIVSTSGYATVDYEYWPEICKHIIVLLMITGACAGSTAGGLKLSRVVILVKSFFTEIKHIIDPRSITLVKINKKPVDKETLIGTRIYASSYFIIICLSTLFISLDGLDLTTNLTAVLSCFNNIGPGLAKVGPMANFSVFSDGIMVFLSALMLTGRLEIFPMFMLFSKSSHDRK